MPVVEAPSSSIVETHDPQRLTHGNRSTYRRGCRCTRCRAANARYWRFWWTAKKHGRRLLGARISAVEAHRVIALLKRDWLSRMELARALGIPHSLARLTRQDMVTLRTELKVRRLYRTRVLEHFDGRRVERDRSDVMKVAGP